MTELPLRRQLSAWRTAGAYESPALPLSYAASKEMRYRAHYISVNHPAQAGFCLETTMSRYANKRLHIRTTGGQFRKAQMSDVGIGGTCSICLHFLLRHYDGDPRDTTPDPRRFRYRCFTCEPETDQEKALRDEIEAAQPKQASLMEIFS